MRKYTELQSGVIEWREVNGESTTIGLIIEGQTKTRQVQAGETEPELDEDGNVIAEAQPIFEDEVYSPWDELLDSGATIQWISDEEKDAAAKEAKRQAAKAKRDAVLQEMSYTTSSGVEIQTRPQDQAIIQIGIETGETEWVAKDNKVYKVSKKDLEDAYKEGVKQAKKIWREYKQEIKKL